MSWAVNGQAAYKGRSKAAPARVVSGMKSTGTKSVNRGANNAITVKKAAVTSNEEILRDHGQKGGLAAAAWVVSFVQSNVFSNKIDQGEKAPSNP